MCLTIALLLGVSEGEAILSIFGDDAGHLYWTVGPVPDASITSTRRLLQTAAAASLFRLSPQGEVKEIPLNGRGSLNSIAVESTLRYKIFFANSDTV